MGTVLCVLQIFCNTQRTVPNVLEILFDFAENGIGIDAGKAAVIAINALLFSVNGTRTARQVRLHAILRFLAPA